MLLTTVLLALVMASLFSIMTTRVTEKPIRIPFVLVESGANTFTTTPIQIPSVPSITLSRGDVKAIGVEVMKVYSNIVPPDMEADQLNTVTVTINKGAAPAAILNSENNLVVWERRIRNDNVVQGGSYSESKIEDLTDGDGNGELVLDDQVHLSILGAGNAAAKSAQGWMLVHLVEFDAKEAVFEILETAQ